MAVTTAVTAETSAAQAALAALERAFKSLGAAQQRVQASFAPGKAALSQTTSQAKTTGVAVDKLGDSLDKTNKKAASLGKGLVGLKSMLTGAAAAIGLSQYTALSDTYTTIENKLRLVTTGAENLKAVNDELFASANRSRTSWEANAELYGKVARNSKQLGLSQRDVLTMTEAVAQSMTVSGASTAESASGIKQLGQAMAKGVLNGDELNSIMENTPRTAQAIADGMGITIGQLKKYGTEGKLSAKLVSDALLKEAPKIAAEFQTMTPTIKQSLTVLGNNLTKLVGDFNANTGAAAGMSSFVLLLANNLDIAAIAATGLGIALLAMNGPKILNGIKAATVAIRAMGVAMTANPVGLAIAAIALAVTGLVIVWDKWLSKIKVTSDGAVTLGQFFGAAMRMIGDAVSKVATFFGDLWEGKIKGVSEVVASFVSGFKAFLGDALQFGAFVASSLIDHWAGCFSAIGAIWGNLPAILSDIGTTAINGMIGIIERGVNAIAGVLREGPLAPFLGGKGGGNISLARVANANAGAAGRVGQAYNSRQGMTGRVVNGVIGAVTDEARRGGTAPAGGGVSNTRTTPTPTAASDKKGKGGGASDAQKKAEDYAKALAELDQQLKEVAYTERQKAAADALENAGLIRNIDATDSLSKAIIEHSNRLFDARKLHDDMKASVDQVTEAKLQLRNAELDLLAVSDPARAASERARDAAKAAYDQSLKEIALRELDISTRAEQIRLAEAYYATQLRTIQADENKTSKDFGKDLGRATQDAAVDNRSIRDPQAAERERAMLQIEREKQDRITELNAAVKTTDANYNAYMAEIEALSNQQVINVEERLKNDKSITLFQETRDLFVDIFKGGEKAMAEFFVKLLAQQLQAIAYAKIMKTTMAEANTQTGGGGIGGFVSSFLSSMMKGGKSGGGPMMSGGIYPTGESGVEMMFNNSNGYLMSNRRLQESMAGMGGGVSMGDVNVYLPAGYQGSPSQVATQTSIHTRRALHSATRK